MQLELTDEEAAALLRLLNRTIEDDRYPLSAAHQDAARHSAEAAGRCTGTAASCPTANGTVTPRVIPGWFEDLSCASSTRFLRRS
jgi:hypothetical protein